MPSVALTSAKISAKLARPVTSKPLLFIRRCVMSEYSSVTFTCSMRLSAASALAAIFFAVAINRSAGTCAKPARNVSTLSYLYFDPSTKNSGSTGLPYSADSLSEAIAISITSSSARSDVNTPHLPPTSPRTLNVPSSATV